MKGLQSSGSNQDTVNEKSGNVPTEQKMSNDMHMGDAFSLFGTMDLQE